MVLAALLRERRQAEAAYKTLYLGDRPLTVHGLIGAATSFISADPERGKRGKALTGAAFGLVFSNVESDVIKGSLRHGPKDVQIFHEAPGPPAQRYQVRQKPVAARDDLIFLSAVAESQSRSRDHCHA